MAKKEMKVTKNDLVRKLTNRYNVTAREARDIITAVGTAGQFLKPQKIGKTVSLDKGRLKAAAKDLKKQVKETGRAAVTGKKGSRAKEAKITYGYGGERDYGKVLGSSKKGVPGIFKAPKPRPKGR